MQQNPAGILISVADVSVLGPAIDAAIGAGVPVITIDSDAVGSKRLFFIGTNNLEAGRMGGHRVVEQLGGVGNVVFFTISGQPNMEERLKGFKDVLDTRSGIHIVDVIDIKSDARTAFDKAQELMAQTGPKKINAFVCLESASGKMVSDAVKRTNSGDRVVVAWDVNQDTLDGIDGRLYQRNGCAKAFHDGIYRPAVTRRDFSRTSGVVRCQRTMFSARMHFRPSQFLSTPARHWSTSTTSTPIFRLPRRISNDRRSGRIQRAELRETARQLSSNESCRKFFCVRTVAI